jgi:Ser/Thr protein kinase RdoA (MazF antagonist)
VSGTALAQARRRIAPRPARDRIVEHLEACHPIKVAALTQLDLGVYRVSRHDGPPWVARIFPAVRPAEAAQGDAEILQQLAALGYPAERPAGTEPASEIYGQGALVTEFADGVPRTQRRDAIRAAGGLRRLGEMLGELHTLPAGQPAMDRPGGGWHHLVDGTGEDEVAAARALLADSAGTVAASGRHDYDTLRRELDGVDDGAGLPAAFTHPDFVLPNVIAPPEPGMIVIDWTGAGTGPRAWTLAFLLWAEGARNLPRVDLVAAGYRRRVRLEPEELHRLPAMMRARPVVLAAWSFCLGRMPLAGAARDAVEAGEIAAAAGARAAAALGG